MSSNMNTGKPMDSSPKLMKRVIYNQNGGPEVLEIQETEIPQAKENEVLVRMIATSVNPADLIGRKGNPVASIVHRSFPKTLGLDVVGIIDKIGPNVTDFKVGDMVWGGTGPKSNATAQFVVMNVKNLSLMPTGIDPIKAAAFPCAGNTAYYDLVIAGKIKAGDRVLIRGAGGVGIMAVQIAKALGAHVTVIASGATVDIAKVHGAEEAFDYRKVNLKELGKFDIVLDTVGTELEKFRKLLKPKGKLLTTVVSNFFKALFSFWHGRHRTHMVLAWYTRKTLEGLAKLVDSGSVVPIIDSVYPMEQIVEAHRHAEKGSNVGKIIITIPQT